MKNIQALCVYCGSTEDVDPIYLEAAKNFGTILAAHGIRLIYGGGGVGLMGAIADAVLAHNGDVTGIMPEFLLDIEVAHEGVTEMIVVDSMHSRKQKMFELADAFVVLPGGFGTLDEVVEILTWKQLCRHDKPILLANIAGYWGPLIALIAAITDEGFAQPQNADLLTTVPSVEAILPALAAAPEPAIHTVTSKV
ncbi:MAG: TIGR00730 family Rossman fold protein [Rhodospirillaceae bacterium]|nr:MAG: TIGR00730 family Rossman fold protein [Rhodospirillaceae bacterium]